MKKLLEKLFKIEFIRYGMVGAVSTVLDICVLKLTYSLMHNDIKRLWLATAIGFIAGTINGYYMNSRWTFKYNTKGKEAAKFSQFATISLVGLGLTEIIVLNLTTKASLSETIAKLVAVAIVFFWNYFGNKFWTFRKQK